MDIISIAQHARPNDMGQIELRRAQFTTLSSDANKIPSSFRKFSAYPGAHTGTPFARLPAMAYVHPYRRDCWRRRYSFCLFPPFFATQRADAFQNRSVSVLDPATAYVP